jgi:ATP-dependent Clp protease ATP-binding subunit ClpA
VAAFVGRDQELKRLERFLQGAHRGRAALVVEGDPGIGKTTVWRGLRLAEEHGRDGGPETREVA